MAHDLRQGLVTLPSRDAIVPSWRDARQWILAAAADRRVVGKLLGGPGVYAGGAAGLADLGDGTVMPALVALVADGAGELWAVDLPASVVRFDVTDAAAAEVWLEPRLIPSLSAPAALGGAGDWQVVARAAGVAPASALLLGTGTIAGSRLTAWARAAGPGTGLVVPTAHGPSHGATGPDALDLSGYGLVADADPRLAAALAALPRAGGDMTGILGLIAGGLRLPRWPHFGPPTAGSADLLGLDRAGAWWLRDATSWRQMTAGTPLAWSGGGADDVTAAVNWAQGLADRYRAVDPGYGEWEWDPLIARWRGRVTTMVDQTARTIAASTLTASMPLDPDYDYAVVSGYWYYTVPDATGTEVGGFYNTIRGRSQSPALAYIATTDSVVPGSNWTPYNVLSFSQVQIPVIDTVTYRAVEFHLLRISVDSNWSISHRGVKLRLQDLRR